jgi:hypothetical protein
LWCRIDSLTKLGKQCYLYQDSNSLSLVKAESANAMNTNLESVLIFVGAIAGLIFVLKILQLLISKPKNLPPAPDQDEHIFYDEDFLDYDD